MHSCITTLLLILSTLSSAFPLQPSSSPSELRHQPPPHTHCIERSSSYWDSGYRSIFFHHADKTLFNFSIVTGYMRFYPPTITAWLQEKDFHIVKATTIPKPELCGWIQANSVLRGGRQHGAVFWKRSNASAHATPLLASNATVKAVPRADLSVLGMPRPHDDTFKLITSILYNNTPDADRYYLMTVMLGVACATMGFTLVFYGLMGYATLRMKHKNSHKPAHVELDQIKVHHLSGSGMQRLGVDKPNDVNGKQESVGLKSTTPPPVYSVDGAGR